MCCCNDWICFVFGMIFGAFLVLLSFYLSGGRDGYHKV